AGAVRDGLELRGWTVPVAEADPLGARLLARDPASGTECRADLRKEVLWRPPVQTAAGPTLSLEDLVGTTVRSPTDRGLPRDLIDVHAAARLWSRPVLEELGRRPAPRHVRPHRPPVPPHRHGLARRRRVPRPRHRPADGRRDPPLGPGMGGRHRGTPPGGRGSAGGDGVTSQDEHTGPPYR